MDDEAFEASLEGDATGSLSEATPEPESDDTQVLDESHEDDVESPTEASEDVTEDLPDEELEEVEAEEESSEPDDTEEEVEETLEPEETEQVGSESAIYKPFKASGREVTVKTEEEALQLMKMGVDYSSKLQGFKAHRKTIKTLENNEINEEQLNFLIDLKNGNQEAITKLLKDNKVDPMDMDLEEDSSYKPSDYSVSDSQVELDDVISRIQETTSFSTTSDIITNQWDQSSKQAIFAQPDLLENLNTQVANGTYERVKQEVDRMKIFGGLQGVSDLEAYSRVGIAMEKEGKFTPQPAQVVSTKPTPVKTNKDRKLRASSSKPTRKVKSTAAVNWAEMDDDAFEKLLKGN